MKVAILAGGYGSRLGEETDLRPKPMIEIGGRPILWHIMKYYSHFGHREFLLLLGYKSFVIKDYFARYFLHQSDCTIDLENNRIDFHNTTSEPWRVTLIDTGLHTMTGGRIKQLERYVGNERFFLTYGDGVSNVDLKRLLEFHEDKGRVATLTAVRPEGRFGIIDINESGGVSTFAEKPKSGGGWINGGFFVLEPKIFRYLTEDSSTVFEQGPLEQLAEEGELSAYKHHGFWKCMDTMRDKLELSALWDHGGAKWKVWP